MNLQKLLAVGLLFPWKRSFPIPALPAAQELLGSATAPSRMYLQQEHGEAHGEAGSKRSVSAGANTAAIAAEEAPLTPKLSVGTNKKLYRRAGEVSQRGKAPAPAK